MVGDALLAVFLGEDRAERLIAQLAATPGETVSPQALAYANRLSDFLFVAARRANANGADDVLWVPGLTRGGRCSPCA